MKSVRTEQNLFQLRYGTRDKTSVVSLIDHSLMLYAKAFSHRSHSFRPLLLSNPFPKKHREYLEFTYEACSVRTFYQRGLEITNRRTAPPPNISLLSDSH